MASKEGKFSDFLGVYNLAKGSRQRKEVQINTETKFFQIVIDFFKNMNVKNKYECGRERLMG